MSPTLIALNLLVVLLALALTVICLRHIKGRGAYLCADCRFNDPISCLKSDRPEAVSCTSYRQIEKVSNSK
ncbi:MAG: hypothetical protein IPP57_01295 [Candidatus Obscuribacter sp.]|jgi:predicted RNA-binding protein YlxR (DUF448 family)|nr:hypothetical protein [Candidatus Obscuribacter sp.]MBK9769463.1 hypothetical protein [Candidatus Obscuribacter sp.]MDQ5964587.1 hypothetical protein [Cyanobacteriota bacterium erpe_2018_sw_39hr_WHONDRS-SW48-000098_B_bin.30]